MLRKKAWKESLIKETKNILCSCQSTLEGIKVEILNIPEEVKRGNEVKGNFLADWNLNKRYGRLKWLNKLSLRYCEVVDLDI